MAAVSEGYNVRQMLDALYRQDYERAEVLTRDVSHDPSFLYIMVPQIALLNGGAGTAFAERILHSESYPFADAPILDLKKSKIAARLYNQACVEACFNKKYNEKPFDEAMAAFYTDTLSKVTDISFLSIVRLSFMFGHKETWDAITTRLTEVSLRDGQSTEESTAESSAPTEEDSE